MSSIRRRRERSRCRTRRALLARVPLARVARVFAARFAEALRASDLRLRVRAAFFAAASRFAGPPVARSSSVSARERRSLAVLRSAFGRGAAGVLRHGRRLGHGARHLLAHAARSHRPVEILVDPLRHKQLSSLLGFSSTLYPSSSDCNWRTSSRTPDSVGGMRGATRIAVADLGTNSTRLLVADVTAAGALEQVEHRTVVTRLGEGVDGSGRLADAALARVHECLADYREIADRLGADRSIAVATSAVRDAENGDQFREDVRERHGFDIRVISGDEEARLTFLGATAATPAEQVPRW
ncbi:MAG: hypothetical protein WKF40_04960 [Thermoleophilaceae bacterium]